MHDPKDVLHHYLRQAREALVWKTDGVTEYDVRRPLTPTGTNLLGLVKHLSFVELGYLGDVFGRPHGEPYPWGDDPDDVDPHADLVATADESRADILALHQRAAAHGDATIEALDLDTEGTVPWWGSPPNPVTLQLVIVHLMTEYHRHLGQVDILRETIDGARGLRPDNSNVEEIDWEAHVAMLESIARQASGT